jgi:hypothetical protein
MSEKRSPHRAESVSREERVDDAVDRWHRAPGELDVPLHEYLGWTWDEYAEWVASSVLPPERKGAK